MIFDMIEVVQGSLGSGKSLVGMYECVKQLKRGGVVATNFEFNPVWAYILAGSDLRTWAGFRDRFAYSSSLYKRAFMVGNPQSMIELSGDEGRGLADLCVGKQKRAMKKSGRGHATDGKGLLVLDDCHHFFNSRTFSGNKEYVEFFANARKWGWRTLLITHDINNIDKQIRSYVELESRFRNLKKMRIPYTPLPLSPFNLFMVVRRYAGLGAGRGMAHSKDLFPMDSVVASLYNTLERFSSDKILGEYKPQGLDPKTYVYRPATCTDQPAKKKKNTGPYKLIGQSEPYPQYYS